MDHFPNRAHEELYVLDIGTGPGFFAILLSEMGFCVTAVDLTPAMLDEARRNAGRLAEKIRFLEMNAEQLDFPDDSFDVIVSRNLTWNLPHPEKAYAEWSRVLRPGGLLLNFDANWYSYLFDSESLSAYKTDRINAAAEGIHDANIGENFDIMEDIARRLRDPQTGLGSGHSGTARTARRGGRDLLGKGLVPGRKDQFFFHTHVYRPGRCVNSLIVFIFLKEPIE